MARIKAMLKTTAVRLSLLYLLLFVVSATALLFYISAQSERAIRGQTERAIEREVRAINNTYRRSGVNGLVRQIERRSRQPGSNLYIIASPNGEIFAGNVAEIQPGIFDQNGDIKVPFKYKRFGDFDAEYTALAHVMELPNGFKLLVGRDLAEPDRFSNLIERALMSALAIMGLGALAIWFFVGRSALKRIDRMSAASEKIMAGDLSQRLPVMGSGDEFDRMSTSLNTMLGRIEQLNEGLRQVSDNIAHDLKTPLTRCAIAQNQRWHQKQQQKDYRAALEDMISESDQLIRIFSALLMISRVEAGSAAAKLSDLDLSAVALDAAELYEPVAEDADVKLITEIDKDITISGNRELIGQTLSNLMDNAIKYSSLEEKTRKDARIWVRLKAENNEIVLSVADNGPGIPKDKYDEVTKRFVRLDKSRNKPGTGLGLSLVDAVMRMHRGELELSATDDQQEDLPGLTVSLKFPIKT